MGSEEAIKNESLKGTRLVNRDLRSHFVILSCDTRILVFFYHQQGNWYRPSGSFHHKTAMKWFEISSPSIRLLQAGRQPSVADSNLRIYATAFLFQIHHESLLSTRTKQFSSVV